MIVTLMALSLALQEADRPPAPGQDALSQQAQPLRRTSTDDRNANTEPDTLQEQARAEREASEDRQTQAHDNEADAPPQRRRQDGQGLRPDRRPNPGG